MIGKTELNELKRDVQKFVRKCKKYFYYSSPIKVFIKPSEDHDLYCYPFKRVPEIHLCKKWIIAYFIYRPEAYKRIVHEMLHIVLKLPDNIDYLHYYSYPWKDAFSKTVYEDMQRHQRFYMQRIVNKLQENLLNPYWIEELVQHGRLGWW